MERTYINQLKKQLNQTVCIKGWAQTIRAQSKIQFLVVRDVTGTVQCVIEPNQAEPFNTVKDLSSESVVSITGVLIQAPQAPNGYEIHVETLQVLSKAEPQLPIPIVEKGQAETEQSVRLDYRWIDLRKPSGLLIFKVWTELEEQFRSYCLAHNFLEIHSPKLMSAPSESGAEVFEVGYFDRKAYLAQSPQFYKQMAMAAGFERVFEIGPVFRAEPSFTTRHATEFTGYDFEMSFIDSHHDVMQFWMEMIVHLLQSIQSRFGTEIEQTFKQPLTVPSLPFPKLTMAQAKALLSQHGVASEREGDLSPEEERQLSEIILKTNGHEFVFVTDYPISVRPFYHMRHSDTPELTKSFDLLWNGVEITTGAQREHRYDVLTTQALEKGLHLESIESYLNFFKYGCPPHGGAGIGPARMVMKIVNAENIREVTFLPRAVNRLAP